jgi:hypothetical protein
MHETTELKFIEAKQAKNIYEYKNIKFKLRRTTAVIWFNKTCRKAPDDGHNSARNMLSGVQMNK